MNHEDFIINEIHTELNRLFLTFDTKVLAAAMMIRAGQALRACHSAGVWTVDDVRVVVEEATADVYTPLTEDKVPRIVTTGNDTVQ